MPRTRFAQAAGHTLLEVGRGHDRRAGENPGADESDPAHPAQTILPGLRNHHPGAGPDLPIERGRPGRAFSPMLWCQNISMGYRSFANLQSWRAKVARSNGRRSPIGWVIPPGG
jgi:hypothetical protein